MILNITENIITNTMDTKIPTITTSDYDTIKMYYDDNLNKDTDLVVTINDEPTPLNV